MSMVGRDSVELVVAGIATFAARQSLALPTNPSPPTNSEEILRVTGGAKPIQKDNGPRQGPEICDRPCFHEIARRQRQVARAYYLLLLFPLASGLPRRPGSAAGIFQNRLTYEDKTKNGSAAAANRDRDTQTKTTAAGVCGSQRIPPRR